MAKTMKKEKKPVLRARPTQIFRLGRFFLLLLFNFSKILENQPFFNLHLKKNELTDSTWQVRPPIKQGFLLLFCFVLFFFCGLKPPFWWSCMEGKLLYLGIVSECEQLNYCCLFPPISKGPFILALRCCCQYIDYFLPHLSATQRIAS